MRRHNRPAPFAAPPPVPLRPEHVLNLDFQVTTALYGGGPEAGINDPLDPFRVPGIRGHLRFWWRAAVGARCPSVAPLREEESRIWGSTDHRSLVSIRVLAADRGTERDAAAIAPDGRWQKVQPDYALFPAQEDRRHIGKIYVGGRFQLEIAVSLPKDDHGAILEEINTTLWSWVTFGGIGGRTRRGAGALFCPQYTSWKPELLQGDGLARPWPVLKGSTVVLGSQQQYDWPKCWDPCIRLLREFRQDRNHQRARSNWPEPDAIRILRDQYAPQHPPLGDDRTFPRAALGMPIIFHFKTPRDPEPNTLNVLDDEGKEARMASPVILKPFAVSPSRAVPMLVVLNAPGPPAKRVVLRQLKPKEDDLHAGRDFDLGDREAVLEKLIAKAEQQWNNPRLIL